MRIISGAFKGRKLSSFPGIATRPTTDRVRESIFNILADIPASAAVLDLFAGTGALGLEALSRGAETAVFIDHSPAAIKVIQKNISACRVLSKTRVIQWDLRRHLNCFSLDTPLFDLVFMDPPYGKNLILPVLDNLIQKKLLAAGATIVVEHTGPESLSRDLPGLVLTDQRTYGKTLVSFLSPVVQGTPY